MLTAAVIGCGRMGAEPSDRLVGVLPAGWLPISHAEALRSVQGVQLAALVDSDETKLARHGAHYGVTARFTDYRAMLASVRPDLVTIATRTPEKPAIAQCAAEHGVKGLYVEKPFANSLRKLADAIAATRAAQTVVSYGVNRRFHATYRRAKALLAQGAIGEILDVTVEFGRSQLLWSHPHAVDLMLFLTGETRVETAQASLAADTVALAGSDRVDSDPIVEHAHFTFASGARGTITRAGGSAVRIAGTSGTMTIHGDGDQIQLSTARPGGQAYYYLEHAFQHAETGPSATVTAFNELRDSVALGAAPSISIAEIETGLRMLFGCVWSHLHGSKPVYLQDVPLDLVVTGKFRGSYA